MLTANRAAQRDHWRRAEQPDLHARGSEARLFGRDCQIACGHQLTACGGGNAVNLGDHWLRNGGNGLHKLAAHRKLVLVELGRLADHFAQIVPGAEGWAIAADDHYGQIWMRADRPETADELLH